MDRDRHIRFLKHAFIVNLTLMSLVMIDFVYLDARFVTLLVVLYAVFVVVLAITWTIITRPRKAPHGATAEQADPPIPQRG
ncbi:MAG: hypothetical protein KY455_10345 [Euryarchaeota archaeon]|nr:hypothetical protein [Euryarchaeota archaeon]